MECVRPKLLGSAAVFAMFVKRWTKDVVRRKGGFVEKLTGDQMLSYRVTDSNVRSDEELDALPCNNRRRHAIDGTTTDMLGI